MSSPAPRLTPERVRELFEEAKENVRREKACPRHQFTPPVDGKFKMGARYRCLFCGWGGRLSDIAPYCRGYAAAGGNPDDVFPGLIAQ